jgi:CubicO group peptidase (beta-lactamase class C family)
MKRFQLYNTPANKDITIRHLLTHTSGISYGTDPNNPMMKIFAKKGIPPLNSLNPITLKEVVEKLASCPLEHDPGEKFTYGMSVDVLGYLIEVVSKMPVDQYFKEKIFEPLGMNDTYFYVPKEKQNRIVTLYQKEQNKALQPSSISLSDISIQWCSNPVFDWGWFIGYCRRLCKILPNDSQWRRI